MADFLNDLPLSSRRRRDESTVGDRRAQVDALVQTARELIDSAPLAQRESLATAFLTSAGLEVDALVAGHSPRATTHEPSIRDLDRTLYTLLDLAEALDTDPEIDGLTTGAVALYRSGRVRYPQKAVVHGSTLRATDADWQIGYGPVLEGTALEIVRFFDGRGTWPAGTTPR
ncbi:hypothetical protein MN032_07395 [Agromyces atrinae]|uniref:hypothetical protein n=1 Tax=Agromyces atrinae TaxID=592376 RepID=UPI001F58FC8E|nr:hypothetical protein [Agromyces atrinae]MCI2957510.1 hypothetical protein [Agromyces atrinae]